MPKIVRPHDKHSTTEVLGGALVEFTRGTARADVFRAGVVAGALRRGYRYELDDDEDVDELLAAGVPATIPVPPLDPTAPPPATLLAPAVLPPVPAPRQ